MTNRRNDLHWGSCASLGAAATSLALVLVLLAAATAAAHGQTFNVIYSFTGGIDGANPTASLTMDKAGNLYGTTSYGYANAGSVFKLTHSGSGGWIFSPLYGFKGGGDGHSPYAAVTFGPDGNLYGTTALGGLGYGTVFSLRPPATPCKTAMCPWLETVLYRFTGGTDGVKPLSAVAFDQAGNLYGTTQFGGVGGCYAGSSCGLVYKLTPTNGGWTESVVYRFTGGIDGAFPIAGLVFDQAGNLYGTASGGGIGGGTVFELTPSVSGWTEKTLYAFQEGSDGGLPWAGVTFDRFGNLFGATSAYGNGLGGTVFELSPSDENWIFTLIYTFDGGSGGPRNSLVMDSGGALYGAAFVINGGLGTAFKLSPSNDGRTYTDLHDFTGGGDGGYAWGGVTLDMHGNLYGTTLEGGVYGKGCYGGCGVVYQVAP